MPFLIIFVIIPFMEIAVFLSVGEEIGILKTLLLCALTAIIGGFLVKKQGLETLFKGQNAMSRGEMPIQEIFDGFCIVIAGAMLITPGFVTDTIGFSLLIPQVRHALMKYIKSRMDIKVDIHTSYTESYTKHHDKNTIEGHFERVDKNNQDE